MLNALQLATQRLTSWVTLACVVFFGSSTLAQQQQLISDYFVRPVQGAIPGPYGPGVALQGIQPFDPYASAPTLPPPLTGGSYAPAYPAPSPDLSAPPIAPPLSSPVVPPSGYGSGPYGNAAGGPYGGGQSGSLFGGPSPFNLNGGGFYGGFQAPVLQPRYGGYSIVSNEFGGQTTTVKATPNHNLAFSMRFIAGYEGPGGLGFRARWWHFDDTTNGVGTVRFGATEFESQMSAQLELDAIDMELTQAGRFHNWEFLVSGGVRYGDVGSRIQSTFGTPERLFRTTSGFTGVGPVLGIGTERALRQWEGLAFVFNSRFSFLFGDYNVRNSSDLPNGVLMHEDLATVQDVMPNWELQIGAHWTRRMNSGATFYLGAFFEAQLWDWISPGQINSDLGFWGPTFAVGITQ
ncbi:MAG: hypothetical protein KDB27_11100 [Planctomycetales bacterium]|nr:hypothetical protein [Planctomycetales bacterium]